MEIKRALNCLKTVRTIPGQEIYRKDIDTAIKILKVAKIMNEHEIGADELSQALQNAGYEEASKAIDCYLEL